MEMERVKRTVRLNEEERKYLEEIVSKGKHMAREMRRAQVLLLIDEDRVGGKKTIAETAEILGVGTQMVSEVKKRYNEEGAQAAITRKKRVAPPVEPKITGDVEARIIAASCSKPPKGMARWTLRLLTERIIELEIVDSISDESVRQVLKKTKSSRT